MNTASSGRIESLRDIDKVYNSVSTYMSVRDKITYCAQLIYRTHTHLSRNNSQLTRESKNRALEVLQQAREELRYLLNGGK